VDGVARRLNPDEMSSEARRAGACVAALALAVYLTTTGGSFATDLASYEVTKNLVEQGSVAMSHNLLDTEAERGIDGRYYAPVGIGHPIFGIPFYVGAKAVQAATGLRVGKPESLTKAAVVMGSAVAAAGCVYFAFLFAWRLAGALRAATLTALAFAFATPLWVYAKFGFNAPLAAMWLLAAAYAVWIGVRERRRASLVLGGAALGAALLTRHEMMVGVAPVALWLWLESGRERRALVERARLVGMPVVIALGLWCLYNYVRFGHPLDTGLMRDPNVSFDTPVLVGLHGLLLSPGRSMFLYAPLTAAGVVALVQLGRSDRSTAIFLGAFPAAFLPVYAMMRQWDGGESYGPRYLVPVIAFLILPIAPWLARASRSPWRVLLRVVALLSVAVQIPGVLVDFSKAQQQYARATPSYSIQLTRYTWEAAPLVLNTRTALATTPENIRYLLGRASPPTVTRTAGEHVHDFSQQFAFSLDFWWLYLFYLGVVPAWMAIALGMVPLLAAAPAALVAARTLRHTAESVPSDSRPPQRWGTARATVGRDDAPRTRIRPAGWLCSAIQPARPPAALLERVAQTRRTSAEPAGPPVPSIHPEPARTRGLVARLRHVVGGGMARRDALTSKREPPRAKPSDGSSSGA
jgi:hypothetical protein